MTVLTLGLVTLALGALCGLLLLTSSGSPLLFLIGLFGLICAYFYSATSRSLSSLVLGELVSFAIFGPLLTISAYLVQTGAAGQINRTLFIFSLVPGLLAAAFIHLNNMRDAESDSQARKHTLASFLDYRLSRLIYLLLLLGAYVPILAMGIPRHAPHLLLLTLWTFPSLIVLISGVLRTNAPASLHWHMRKTLRLEVQFVVLLSIALIATTYLSLSGYHFPNIALPF